MNAKTGLSQFMEGSKLSFIYIGMTSSITNHYSVSLGSEGMYVTLCVHYTTELLSYKTVHGYQPDINYSINGSGIYYCDP